MKLDDLKKMDIPRLAPIEVKYNRDSIPAEVSRYLGYFRSVEENKLTYYHSPDPSSFVLEERYSSFQINRIISVTMLVQKNKR
ncbi:MAG: hypothetical protein AABX31_05630 [Nanoarchaeota archaeon]